jgi:hypothetical protein
MRALDAAGFLKVTIAAAYGVSDTLVCQVTLRRRWNNVPDLPTPLPAIAYAGSAPLRLIRATSQLNEQQVIDIRRLAAAGYTQASIGAVYNVPQSVVSEIVNGTIYSTVPNIPGPPPTLSRAKRSLLKLRSKRGRLTGSRNRSVSRSRRGAVGSPRTGRRSHPMKYCCGSRSRQSARLDGVSVRQNKVGPG